MNIRMHFMLDKRKWIDKWFEKPCNDVEMWAVEANSALLKYFERNICSNIHIYWLLETLVYTWEKLSKTDLRLTDPDLQQKHGASEQKLQSCQLSESF